MKTSEAARETGRWAAGKLVESDQGNTMVSWARVVTLVSLISFLSPLTRAQLSQPASPIAALQGKVLNAEGRPVSGVHIELDDAKTAVPVSSTYTQPDGTFELYNIPKGNYEVVAESPDSQVSNPVLLDAPAPTLELQLPGMASTPTPLDATTSVARMLVPASAQRLYDRAFKDFLAGKYDETEKQLDAALQIDQDYADALTLKGVLLVGRANIPEGQQALEHAIKVDPSQSAAYITLAAVYNHEARFDDAMSVSQKGLSLAPRMWQAYMEMAKASIAKSMYQTGLKFVREAERLGGNTYAEVHLVKAYALMPLKLYKDAKYELQACLAHEHHGPVADQAQRILAQLNSLESESTTAHP